MADRPPYVREMIAEAIEALGGRARNTEIRDWIVDKYPGTNENTIFTMIIVLSVNHPSRIHYPENSKPRRAEKAIHDRLYRPERGVVERYDPARHGQWAIEEADDGALSVVVIEEGEADVSPDGSFAAEAHLRDYLVEKLRVIEPGLELYATDQGDTGKEFVTPIGRIDILARDARSGFVVCELKLSRGPDAVAGQVLRYVNWVERHLTDGAPVRGIIIAREFPEGVRYALAGDPRVEFKRYRLDVRLEDVAGLR